MPQKKRLYYVETGLGCGLRTGSDADEVYNEELESVGTHIGVDLVREATAQDISWVKGMGGHIPKI